MIVYRIECREDRIGPYLGHCRGLHGDAASNRPVPEDDGIRLGCIGLRFGFCSRESLFAWFAGDLALLEAEGYCIRAYIVPIEDMQRGQKQAVFPSCYHEDPAGEWLPTDPSFYASREGGYLSRIKALQGERSPYARQAQG